MRTQQRSGWRRLLALITGLSIGVMTPHSSNHPSHDAMANPALIIPVAKSVLECIDIGVKIYEASKPDELGEASRKKIEEVLEQQKKAGFIPLSMLDAEVRETLGGQGRLELGIDQLHQHLDVWGDKLLAGQGELSDKLNEVLREVRSGHERTQQVLQHLVNAELSTGLRSLSDALALLKLNPEDALARQSFSEAKSALVKHMEFLKQEERAGKVSSVEHWALLRLSLASSYLGLGLKESAVDELAELLALPIEAEGLARLKAQLPPEISQEIQRYFDHRSPTLDRRIKWLRFAEKRLGQWLESIKAERERLNNMKRQARALLEGEPELNALWRAREASILARAKKTEDEQALHAFMLLAAELSDKKDSIGITWVRIPAGSFEMGSNDGYSDERPVHRVRVGSFLMSKTEVTVGQYRKCVEAGRCSEPNTGDKCNWGESNREDYPINCVDWGQARTFAKWVGADVDLPSEAEWEYAARGGQSYRYAGSNDVGEVGWYDSNSGGSTHSVGKKKANGFGLYDMSGNVWEWTLDEHHNSYSGAPSDGRAWGDVPTCRQGCDKGSARRVIRGGSWRYVAGSLRVAGRFSISPDFRFTYLGFRLRRTIP